MNRSVNRSGAARVQFRGGKDKEGNGIDGGYSCITTYGRGLPRRPAPLADLMQDKR